MTQGFPTDDQSTGAERPYQPIAVGFFLLAVPLLVTAVFLSGSTTGRVTNTAAAVVFVLLGLTLLGRRSG